MQIIFEFWKYKKCGKRASNLNSSTIKDSWDYRKCGKWAS